MAYPSRQRTFLQARAGDLVLSGSADGIDTDAKRLTGVKRNQGVSPWRTSWTSRRVQRFRADEVSVANKTERMYESIVRGGEEGEEGVA